jgi:hypothetical protein
VLRKIRYCILCNKHVKKKDYEEHIVQHRLPIELKEYIFSSLLELGKKRIETSNVCPNCGRDPTPDCRILSWKSNYTNYRPLNKIEAEFLILCPDCKTLYKQRKEFLTKEE